MDRPDIIDSSSPGGEEVYQEFLRQNPAGIVVNEGENGKPDLAHLAGCHFTRKISTQGKRWEKYCFASPTTFSKVLDWYRNNWPSRLRPIGCKICKPQ